MAKLLETTAMRIVTAELRRLPRTKWMGDEVQIVCPFHNDSDPSCGVNLGKNPRLPIGYFNCWSCPASGPWNKLADKLGLAKIDQNNQTQVEGVSSQLSKQLAELRHEMLTDLSGDT